MRLTTFIKSIAFLGLAACTGSIPDNPGDPDAAGPDGDPGATMVTVSGRTLDYFAANAPAPIDTPLMGTTVSVTDVIPAVNNTSDGTGVYTFDAPPGSTAYALTTRTSYRTTRNVPTVTVTPDLPVMQDLYSASLAESLGLYNNAVGGPIDVDSNTAVIVAELFRNNGMPLETATVADISLVDNAIPPAPVLGIDGPFFFDINGNLDPALTTGVLVNGKIRVAILNCPVALPGVSYNLLVNYLNDGAPATFTVPIMCDDTGFTLARTGTGGGGGGGGGGGNTPTNPTFVTDIYPRLQTPAVSPLGRACSGCHNDLRLAPNGPTCLANPGACVPWSAQMPATDLHAALIALPGVIDLANPALSLFLTKPLRELTPPQNHPNVTFLNEQDPDYMTFMLWIQQGALLGP